MKHPNEAYALFQNGEAIAITNTRGLDTPNRAYVRITRTQIDRALIAGVPVIKGQMLERDLVSQN